MLPRYNNGTRVLSDFLRISFKTPYRKVNEDRLIFEKWRAGKITAEEGAHLMSINNMTPINVDQFLANAEWLGYSK